MVFSTSRSSSPISLASDIEYSDLYLDELFQEGGTDSPEPMSLYDEGMVLCPDSPVPDYGHAKYETVICMGSRSSSPTSLISDIEYSELCLEGLFNEDRSWSPESSHSPDAYRLLSPDSPIPMYEAPILQQLNYTTNRSSSPVSVTSDIEYSELCLSELFSGEDRPYSPESVNSLDVYRPPDSPINQFGCPILEEFIFTGSRSSSPTSLASDIQYSEICLKELFQEERPRSPDSCNECNEHRPLTPDSPIPEYSYHTFDRTLERTLSAEFRPLSPDLLTLNNEYDTLLFEFGFDEVRPDSPWSFSIVDKYRPLSPESPLPYFSAPILECVMPLLGCTSPSTESLVSDIELSELCLDILFDYERPESPESDSVKYEVREHSGSHSDVATHRQPYLDISDSDIAHLCPDYPEHDTRHLSPQASSVSGVTCLPNDSPCSQVRTSLSDDRVPCIGDRSPLPKSIASDINQSRFGLGEMSRDQPGSPKSDVYDNAPQESTSLFSDKDSSTQPFIAEKETSSISPVFQLVYKTAPSKLIAHMYDPLYKGETFISKSGVFERVGLRTEK
ncbi:uncharacterized protein LOC121721240 isoform X2 [Alosa sapidissima]|nr:uncharacterized protein LOC121721240 isoform X2 [Alosa sapidissima]